MSDSYVTSFLNAFISLQWRHNERDCVSNHQLTIVYSTVSGTDQRNISASLAIVLEIHLCPVNSPHKDPVARQMFPFDDVIMILQNASVCVSIAIYKLKIEYTFIYKFISVVIVLCL